MSLTIEKPETEARLIRYAAARGISPQDALDVLLDFAEDQEGTLDLETLPDLLRGAKSDALWAAQAEMDRGEWISGQTLLDELRKPLKR